MGTTIGILKEPAPEKRVSFLPEGLSDLKKLNLSILVEENAGKEAYSIDSKYIDAESKILDRKSVIDQSEIILSITPPDISELQNLSGKVLISVLDPLRNKTYIEALKETSITAFSMDNIPRTTRAQSMDILSSMATAAGYKAVLVAAINSSRFFPMFTTAAGSIIPSKVLILGAGVAGLQAIATAKRLGAIVHAFDVRAAVKEEVQSLGAKFIEVEGAKDNSEAGGYAVEQAEDFKKKQIQAIKDHAIKSNIIITTAQIPGRQAPLLLPEDTVNALNPGTVIIDMAASSGGNCAYSKNNETVDHNGVVIIGDSNLASSLPYDASKMLGKNIFNFLKLIIDEEGGLILNFEDDIVKETCIIHNNEIVSTRIKDLLFETVS